MNQSTASPKMTTHTIQEPIIDPVPTEQIEAELTPQHFLRCTNKGGNLIYVVDGRHSPAVMQELGRLREISFRAAGGGTGKSVDIDEFDLMDPPCRQLIVWDPDARLILGGYRFIIGSEIKLEGGVPRIATAHMFKFSPKFIKDLLPFTIELGRSFVRPEYQSSKAGAKALYALDNLWDGLGALTVMHPEIKYLFGKFTMYPTYKRCCRDMLLCFMHKYFPDPLGLVNPINPIEICNRGEADPGELFSGNDFKEDYRILNTAIRAEGINIPPLVNAYMSLSPTMRMFGTAINPEFGNVEESAIMLTIDEIYDAKKQRHIDTFDPDATPLTE